MDGGNEKARTGALIPVQALERIRVSDFIQERFIAMHEAKVRQFMPTLLWMKDSDGRPVAACGLRGADNGPLFLEHYLGESVEQRLSALIGVSIPRAAIVEVGNLAIAYPGSARGLIAALTAFLTDSDFDWVVFTGVPALRNAFARSGIVLTPLGEALLEALPVDQRTDWGRYYENGAQVCAVSIEAAAAALRRTEAA